MANLNNGDWKIVIKYVSGAIAFLTLLGIITGGVMVYANMTYEISTARQDVKDLEQTARARDKWEKDMQKNYFRLERKIDRLLIEQGIKPESIR